MQPFSLNIRGRLIEYSRPVVMAIVNVTPDSFHAASRTFSDEAIAARVRQAIAEGADMLDVGAYSSRPGADDVPEQEEMARLERALRIVRETAGTEIPVSVDTFRASVAHRAIVEWGADIINDISGGSLDADMFATVAGLQCPYILMHMRGTPADMQTRTEYPSGVTAGVLAELGDKLSQLSLLGVNDVMIDPGFGFSKTLEQNYRMMHDLGLFRLLHRPLLVGVSRKSMLTRLLDITPAEALEATTALHAFALDRGADILRVHDVLPACQAVRIYQTVNFSADSADSLRNSAGNNFSLGL